MYSEACAKTIELNRIKAECRPYGIWWREGELSIGGHSASIGDMLGNIRVKVKPLGEVLREGFDVVKLDCEDCEYTIINVAVRRPPLSH